MHCVELDALPIFQDFWTEQRDIVIMDHIEALLQNLPDRSRLEEREACLLGG